MRELKDRNNQGLLTEAERAEMEAFRRGGAMLAILQSRARIALAQSRASD
jgi:hypothetical protein